MKTAPLEPKQTQAWFEYDFAVNGGAVGTVNLPVAIPVGSIIRHVYIDVITTLTSAGSATVALGIVAAGDTRAATAIASLTAGSLLDGIPDGTASTMLRTTAASGLIVTIAVADLTAGQFRVVVDYDTIE